MNTARILHELHVFLKFWHSDWGAAKSAKWEAFTSMPYHVDSAVTICHMIMAGDTTFNWDAIP
jgi:hypothetical protein